MKRRALTVAIALVACGWLTPSLALAQTAAAPPPSASFTGGFAPDTLGAPSTIELGFQIKEPQGEVPPPLVGIDFRLPAEVSLTTSELGLDSCTLATLANAGSAGCRADTVMGHGRAVIVTPDAAGEITETVGVTVLMGQATNRHTTMLFYANGTSPVIAQQVFSGQLVEASGPFGADLRTTVPLTPGLPGEPDATVVRMQTDIGSKGVTYYKRVHGVRVPYTPKGVILPEHCPAGGFPFAATFLFADGSRASASTTAPCPSRHDPSRHGHARSRRLIASAHVARTISVKETVHATNVNHQGNTVINERGRGTGTFSCPIVLQVRVSYTKGTARLTCATSGGTLMAGGNLSFFSTGETVTFTGTIPVDHGTGSYSHASGQLRVEGTMRRKTFVLEASVSGSVSS
jgi:hypothetical protein